MVRRRRGMEYLSERRLAPSLNCKTLDNELRDWRFNIRGRELSSVAVVSGAVEYIQRHACSPEPSMMLGSALRTSETLRKGQSLRVSRECTFKVLIPRRIIQCSQTNPLLIGS